MTIRDFIYLDIERVRSFYAQLSKGLPTERTVEKTKETGGDASVEGNMFFTKGKGQIDYRYGRANTETFSLHDYIMEEFLDSLKQADILTQTFDNKFTWEKDIFRDGMFILTKGKVKIIDYKYIAATLDRVPKMAKSVNKIAQKPAQNNPSIDHLDAMSKNPVLKEVSQFIEQNMEDSLRIKIYPYDFSEDEVFIATANAINFRYNTVSIINMYGHIVDADWLSLLQVNMGRDNLLVMPPITQTTGKSLEEILESFIDGLTGLNKALQGLKFPSISATPIAIFREI